MLFWAEETVGNSDSDQGAGMIWKKTEKNFNKVKQDSPLQLGQMYASILQKLFY